MKKTARKKRVSEEEFNSVKMTFFWEQKFTELFLGLICIIVVVLLVYGNIKVLFPSENWNRPDCRTNDAISGPCNYIGAIFLAFLCVCGEAIILYSMYYFIKEWIEGNLGYAERRAREHFKSE